MDRRRDSSVRHPVLAGVARIDAALKDLAGLDPGFMAGGEKRVALTELARLSGQLEALRLRVIAAAGEVAASDGMPNVAAWLNPRTMDEPGANHRSEALARSLDRRWQRVAAGLAEGRVSLAQARVVVAALDRLLVAGIDAGLLDRAEAHLVELAADHPPRHLRVLGRRILTVIAPEVADDEERRRLEEEERRAQARARLWFRPHGDGTVTMGARLSEAAAARLRGVLDAFTSPRHDASPAGAGANPLVDPATGAKVPHDQRRGLAFEALLERLDPDRLPATAGGATTLVITMELADLLAGTGAGTLPDGGRLSAGQVRRLACNAGLVPAVLGTDGEVLDLGRRARLFTAAQQRAMALRHHTCRAAGCLVPATWCEGHHLTPWAHGGNTDLADGTLLCPWHHHRIHDPDYTHHRMPNGDIRFHRRT